MTEAAGSGDSIVRAYRLDLPVVHLLVRALAVLERVDLGRKAEHRARGLVEEEECYGLAKA